MSIEVEIYEYFCTNQTHLNWIIIKLISVDNQTYLTRTDLTGKAYDVFKAVGLRPPNTVLEVMPYS